MKTLRGQLSQTNWKVFNKKRESMKRGTECQNKVCEQNYSKHQSTQAEKKKSLVAYRAISGTWLMNRKHHNCSLKGIQFPQQVLLRCHGNVCMACMLALSGRSNFRQIKWTEGQNFETVKNYLGNTVSQILRYQLFQDLEL